MLFEVILLVFIHAVIVKPELRRVPSLYEISKYNDPVLNDIFASSKIDYDSKNAEPAPTFSEQPPPNIPPQYHGEIPIARPDSFQAPVPAPFQAPVQTAAAVVQQQTQPGSFGYEAGQQFGQLAATGAQAFYSGAQQVGQAFGIQPQNYEVPFLNAAASFLGKK